MLLVVTMRTVLFIFLLISSAKAEYTVRCSNSSETGFKFEPSEDNIEGRYKVEWCLKAEKNVIEWEVSLEYNDTVRPSKCQKNASGSLMRSPHSLFYLPVPSNLNCTQVCLSSHLDLVFNNTCYHITSQLHKNKKLGFPYSYLYNVTNNYSKEYFTKSSPKVYIESYDDGLVEIRWFLGNVPATNFSVDILDKNMKRYKPSCSVSGLQQSQVSCVATLPPQSYTTQLVHRAPWTTAPNLFKEILYKKYDFNVSMPGVAKASSSPAGAWRALAAVAGVVMLVPLMLFALWRRKLTVWKKRVRDHWLKTTRAEPSNRQSEDGIILLLYARDCAQFTRAAERLGKLVRGATGCQVIDVYSGEVTRLWAPAGDEWLRLMLSRDDTRVLLLQSPGGALLSAELAETRAGPALVAPLLGTRVVWRRPHAGDALMSLALRLLCAAPPPAPYRKYYVAGFSDLGTEMAAGVTPQRRYTLPEAALCLLRDLAPGRNLAPGLDFSIGVDSAPGIDVTPDINLNRGLDLEPGKLEPLLQEFNEAAEAFMNHVRDNPDYLADELLF